MTEREKMLAGMNYDAFSEDLKKARIRAKLLCRKFNDLAPDDDSRRVAVIKELLGKTRKNVWIEQPFLCDYGENIEVGENFYANYNLVILDCAKVTIGNNVWIGGGTQICPGVTIGDNTVIGAGIVVTKDIPANVVAAGVPCRVMREITLDDLLPEDEGEV